MRLYLIIVLLYTALQLSRGVLRKPVLNHAAYINAKLHRNELPISDFKNRVESMISSSNSPDDFQNDAYFLFMTYTYSLQQHYTDHFKSKKYKNVNAAQTELIKLSKKYRETLKQAIPKHFEGIFSLEVKSLEVYIYSLISLALLYFYIIRVPWTN
jgi:hypothetical protein